MRFGESHLSLNYKHLLKHFRSLHSRGKRLRNPPLGSGEMTPSTPHRNTRKNATGGWATDTELRLSKQISERLNSELEVKPVFPGRIAQGVSHAVRAEK